MSIFEEIAKKQGLSTRDTDVDIRSGSSSRSSGGSNNIFSSIAKDITKEEQIDRNLDNFTFKPFTSRAIGRTYEGPSILNKLDSSKGDKDEKKNLSSFLKEKRTKDYLRSPLESAIGNNLKREDDDSDFPEWSRFELNQYREENNLEEVDLQLPERDVPEEVPDWVADQSPEELSNRFDTLVKNHSPEEIMDAWGRGKAQQEEAARLYREGYEEPPMPDEMKIDQDIGFLEATGFSVGLAFSGLFPEKRDEFIERNPDVIKESAEQYNKIVGGHVRRNWATRIPLATAERLVGKQLAPTYKELSEKHPVATTISGLTGDMWNVLAMYSLIGATGLKKSVSKAIPEPLALSAPFLKTYLPNAAVKGTVWGMKGLMDESLNQFEKGEFQPKKLSSETGKNALFGTMLAAPMSTTSKALQIGGTGATLGTITGIEEYLEDGTIDSDDMLNIGSSTILGTFFGALGYKGRIRTAQQNKLAVYANSRLRPKVGDTTAKAIDKWQKSIALSKIYPNKSPQELTKMVSQIPQDYSIYQGNIKPPTVVQQGVSSQVAKDWKIFRQLTGDVQQDLVNRSLNVATDRLLQGSFSNIPEAVTMSLREIISNNPGINISDEELEDAIENDRLIGKEDLDYSPGNVSIDKKSLDNFKNLADESENYNEFYQNLKPTERDKFRKQGEGNEGVKNFYRMVTGEDPDGSATRERTSVSSVGELEKIAKDSNSLLEFEEQVGSPYLDDMTGDTSDSVKDTFDLIEEDEIARLTDYDEKTQQEFFGVSDSDWHVPLPEEDEVTIYRATSGDSINIGDYVTPSKKYAEDHLNNILDGEGEIIQTKVNKNDLVPVNTSEFKYVPKKLDDYESLEDFYNKVGREGETEGEDIEESREQEIEEEEATETTPQQEITEEGVDQDEMKFQKEIQNHYWNRTKKIVDEYIESNPNSEAAKLFKQQQNEGDIDRAYARALSPDAGNIFAELPSDLQNEWATKQAFDSETGETLTLAKDDTIRGTHIWNAKENLDETRRSLIEGERSIEVSDSLIQQAQEGTVGEARLDQLRKYGLDNKPSDFIQKRESTLLKDRIRNIARGVREGRRVTKKQIKETQTELINIIEDSGLEPADRAKFIRQIKNIQTPSQLDKSINDIQERIGRYSRKQEKRNLRDKIDRELKYTKPVKKGDYRVGKYDYESNKLFKDLRSYNNLTQKEARNKLNELPEEGLTEIDSIKSRFLSYKSNGMKGSVAIHEKVLDDIQKMKDSGEVASDYEEFKELLNREKEINEIVGGIDGIKGDKESWLTKIENAYRRGMTNTYSLLRTIAGPDIARKYDPTLSELKKDMAASKTSEVIMEKAKDLFNLNNFIQTNKKFINMRRSNYTITDRNGLETDISKNEIIDIYNAIKNDLIKERWHYHYGEEEVNRLINELSSAEKEFADYLMETVQSYYDVSNERHIEKFGRDLGRRTNYWPATSKHEPDVIYDDIKQQSEIPSAMKKLVKSNKVKPVPRGAIQKTFKHIEQGEHIRFMSKEYEKLKRIFDDARVETKIKNKFGENVYNRVQEEIDKLSLQQEVRNENIIQKIAGAGIRNWSSAKVMPPTVLARQLGSTVNYADEMPAGRWAKDFVSGAKSPKQTFDFMWEHVGDYLSYRFNRGYNQALTDALEGANELTANWSDIRKGFSAHVRAGDVGAIIYGGYPRLKYELEVHENEQDAIDAWLSATVRGQQSPLKTTESPGQAGEGIASKFFFNFKNTILQYHRKIGNSLIDFRNNNISGGEFAKKMTNYLAFQQILYVLLGAIAGKEGVSAIGRFLRDEDAEPETKDEISSNIAMKIATNPFQSVRFLDDLSEYTYRKALGKRTYGVFSYPVTDDLEMVAQKVSKEEPLTYREIIETASLAQEPTTGVGLSVMFRYYDYFMGIGQEEAEVKPVYNRAKELLEQGRDEEAQEIVDDLSEEEWKVYQRIERKEEAKKKDEMIDQMRPTFEKAQELKEEGKEDEAQEIVDNLTDEEWNAYEELKEQQEELEEARGGIIPETLFDGDLEQEDHLLTVIGTYARAIGTDPLTAFKTMFTDEKLRKIENDIIIMQRMPVWESQRIRENMADSENLGDLSELRLDHIVPLQLGGDNSKENLQLIPKEIWKSYTPVENYLGEKVRDGEMSGEKAQDIIKKYKEGKISSDQIMQ